MNHSSEYEQLELYIQGELSPDEAARIEARLNEDPDTQHRLQSAKLIVEALDHSLAEPKVPPDLAEQIIARLPSEMPRTSEIRQSRRRWSNRRQLVRKVDVIPIAVEGIRKMKRITKFAVAATLVAALVILTSWITIGGGSTNIAFAEVAKALDNVRTATYDCTMEMKNPIDGKTITTTMKTYFLAPWCERVEMSISSSAKDKGDSSIMILDHQAMKGLTLAPEQKLATTIDLSKMKKPPGAENPFQMVRQLVREGDKNRGKEVEPLGRKEIDGLVAVGFRTRSNMADQTFWADPQTARLVRIEVDFPDGRGHGVMSNFRYNMELDPSLFSLEPPAGYTVDKMDAKMPVEDDLINVLRLIAEHNNGTFPATIAMGDKECQQAVQAASMLETQELMKKPETMKLLEELKAQYGKDKDGFMKAWMKAMMPFTQKLTQKYMQGVMFYNILTPANDSHYAGGGVKRDTPDRPIFWYKPTGSDKYRVIYADLSVKDMTPDDVKKLPDANAK